MEKERKRVGREVARTRARARPGSWPARGGSRKQQPPPDRRYRAPGPPRRPLLAPPAAASHVRAPLRPLPAPASSSAAVGPHPPGARHMPRVSSPLFQPCGDLGLIRQQGVGGLASSRVASSPGPGQAARPPLSCWGPARGASREPSEPLSPRPHLTGFSHLPGLELLLVGVGGGERGWGGEKKKKKKSSLAFCAFEEFLG